jgi:hypothetical protein
MPFDESESASLAEQLAMLPCSEAAAKFMPRAHSFVAAGSRGSTN